MAHHHAPRGPDRSEGPQLEPGITLLRTTAVQSPGFVQLVCASLAAADDALWVDSRNTANTYRLYETVTDERTLSGLQIARAFTAYQHFELCRRLCRRVTSDTTLVCLPNLTSLYQDDDVPAHERDQLFTAVCAGLAGLVETYSLRVVISTPAANELVDQLTALADRELSVETTPFGCYFEGDDYETTLYPTQHGWQTTIPYWVELFGAVDDTQLVETAYKTEFAGVA